MIKALLLDLDGTLLDEDKALQAATKAFHDAHRSRLADASLPEFQQRWREVTNRHWARHMAGELDFVGQRRERVREILGTNLSDAEADEAFLPHRLAYEQASCCYDDVVDFLRSTSGLLKMAVTNGQRTQQRAKMERAGLIADIPDMVTPEDAGAWKPDPGIFHHALARLGVSPSEALMIGDDHECDIVGAQNVGLKTFWVRRGINDLSGALAMLSD